MHEGVRGGEQLGHLVGEADRTHARLAAIERLHACAELVVATAHHHHGRARQRERLIHRAVDVSHAPAAPGHHHHRPLSGEPERAPGFVAGGRVQERGVVEPAHGHRLGVMPRHLAHLVHRLGVRDQVKVYSRMRPETQRGEVGDGGHGWHFQAAAQPQPAEP